MQGLLSLFSRRALTEMYNYYYASPYGLCFSIVRAQCFGNWLHCVSLGVGGLVVNLHNLHIRENYILNSNFCHVLNVTCFLLGNSPAYEFYMLTFQNTLSHLHRHVPTHLWRWNRQGVPKRWHIKFRHQGITQKKTYNNYVLVILKDWC